MALGVPGDVVKFQLTNGIEQWGIVIYKDAGATLNVVAYDFAIPNGGQIAHCKEFTTTAATTLSALTD